MRLRIGLDTFSIFILRYFLINDFILTVVYLTYQIKEINRESANLVARHNNAFPGELCHLQKHSLQAVPVNEILNKVRVPIDKYRTALRRETGVRHLFESF